MTAATGAPPVLIERLPSAGAADVLRLTLNRPNRLNALDQSMIDRLRPAVDAAADDPGIAAIVLDGAGERSFCAGGDIRRVSDWIAQGDRAAIARYFQGEYGLDLALHQHPKPIVAWGTGVTLGGGLGLHQGASLRVVTTHATLGMPEISIGLFPDVGAAWFLQRMPGALGLFCGLTGARLGAADAWACGLADLVIDESDRAAALAALTTLPLTGNPDHDRECIAGCLRHWHRVPETGSPLLARADAIARISDCGSPGHMVAALTAEAGRDDWFQPLLERVMAGSPTTFALTLAHFRRARLASLRTVLETDLVLAVQCALNGDFGEGVRALLIDRDNAPRWSPETLADIDANRIESFFSPPWPGFSEAHPLT